MRIFKKLKYMIFMLKLSYYYRMFIMSRDIGLNHVYDKDSEEYAQYLEVVYEIKMEKLLEKESKRFFGEEQ